MLSLTLHQKRECFRNLCHVATAGNAYLTAQEEDILLEAARKLGIYELRAWDILKNAHKNTFVVPEGSQLQKMYLESTIESLVVECDLPDQAYEWCLALAKLLGFDEVILLKTIERISREACLSLVF